MHERFEITTESVREKPQFDGNSLWFDHTNAAKRARACYDGFIPPEEFKGWISDQFRTIHKLVEQTAWDDDGSPIGDFRWYYGGMTELTFDGKETREVDGTLGLTMRGGFIDQRVDVGFSYDDHGELKKFGANFYSPGKGQGVINLKHVDVDFDRVGNGSVRYSEKEITPDDTLAFTEYLALTEETIFTESERVLRLSEKHRSDGKGDVAQANYIVWLIDQANAYAEYLQGNGLVYDRKQRRYFEKDEIGKLNRQRGEYGFEYDKEYDVYRKKQGGTNYEVRYRDNKRRKELQEVRVIKENWDRSQRLAGEVNLSFVFRKDAPGGLAKVNATDTRIIREQGGERHMDRELTVILDEGKKITLQDKGDYFIDFLSGYALLEKPETAA